MRIWKWITVFFLVAAMATCRPGVDRVPEPGVLVDGAPPGEGFRSVVEQVLPAIVFIQAEAMPPPGLERLLPGILAAHGADVQTSLGRANRGIRSW